MLKPDLKLLEIGPDNFPQSSYLKSVPNPPKTWDTLDLYEHPSLTYISREEYHFPIADNTYDIVFSGQVIEHVRKPWRWVQEIARVCRPKGTCIMISPVSWPYHEAPVDCWRLYPEAYRSLCEDAGLHVELSVFESLELPDYSNKYYGVSIDCASKRHIKFKKILGRKIECAMDAICIAKKIA